MAAGIPAVGNRAAAIRAVGILAVASRAVADRADGPHQGVAGWVDPRRLAVAVRAVPFGEVARAVRPQRVVGWAVPRRRVRPEAGRCWAGSAKSLPPLRPQDWDGSRARLDPKNHSTDHGWAAAPHRVAVRCRAGRHSPAAARPGNRPWKGDRSTAGSSKGDRLTAAARSTGGRSKAVRSRAGRSRDGRSRAGRSRAGRRGETPGGSWRANAPLPGSSPRRRGPHRRGLEPVRYR